jgi:hypothetical protein
VANLSGERCQARKMVDDIGQFLLTFLFKSVIFREIILDIFAAHKYLPKYFLVTGSIEATRLNVSQVYQH